MGEKKSGKLYRCDNCEWEGYAKWKWLKLDVNCGRCGKSVHGKHVEGVFGIEWYKKYGIPFAILIIAIKVSNNMGWI